MTFSNINDVIKEDKELLKFMQGIENSTIKLPSLVENTLEMISDGSTFIGIIKDSNKIALCKMCVNIVKKFSSIEAYGESDKIKTACLYSKTGIYFIDSIEGTRIATKNEVKNGVTGLYIKTEYPAGEKASKLLHVITWILCGEYRYLYYAGYDIKYNKDRQVTTSLYDVIVMTANDINEALDWYDTEEYRKARRILEKFTKSYKRMYADSASDEIREVLSVEQIVKDITSKFPYKSEDKDYRRAMALAIEYSERGKKIKPTDIAFMRKQHKRFGEDRGNNEDKASAIIEDMCKQIIEAKKEGKLTGKEFAFKIIDTMRATGRYSGTEKQINILRETIDKINKGEDKDDEENGADLDKNNYSGIGDILEI